MSSVKMDGKRLTACGSPLSAMQPGGMVGKNGIVCVGWWDGCDEDWGTDGWGTMVGVLLEGG